MKTISQTRRENNPIYEVNIDFDAASEAWKAYKRSIGKVLTDMFVAKRL